MTKISEKQLIEGLKTLKEIKPRQEWASLLKSQILTENKVEVKMGIMDVFSSLIFQKKMAYSFAVLLFMVVGVFGFASFTVPGDLLFPVKKMAEQSTASLSGQTAVKQNVLTLNTRISELAQVAKQGRTKSLPSAMSEVNENVKELAQKIKDQPVQDSATLKEIAASLKTLAEVEGTDIVENTDVKDLYQMVVEGQIADLEKTTLTEEQTLMLQEVKDLYEQGDYPAALEKILTINS